MVGNFLNSQFFNYSCMQTFYGKAQCSFSCRSGLIIYTASYLCTEQK